MALKAPETPWWFEAYQDSTVLVAYIANFDSVYKSKPESQLFFLHQLVQQLDAIVLRSGQQLWRMHGFSLPFYCVLCPQCNSNDHANLVFDLALELSAAAAMINLPSGDPVDLRVGLASGSSAAGVIGTSGVTFVVTGKVAQGARHFAQNTAYLTVSEDTWRKLSPENKARGGWCRSSLCNVPAVGVLPCLDYHILPACPAQPCVSSMATTSSSDESAELTMADITNEIALYERQDPTATLWPWPGYHHPQIERKFRLWLGKELCLLDRVALLLVLLVVLSSQLRLMKGGHVGLDVARMVFVGVPMVLIIFQGQCPGLWLHGREAFWLALVLVRKLMPLVTLLAYLLGKHALFSARIVSRTSLPIVPHIADLFDCLTGMLLCRVRFKWQVAASATSGVVSVLVALMHLLTRVATTTDVLIAWLLASVGLVLQNWLAARWEHHQRHHFLSCLTHCASAKPSAQGETSFHPLGFMHSKFLFSTQSAPALAKKAL